MAKPVNLPEVALTNVTLPTAGTDNKLEPTTAIKQVGWDQSQKPAAQHFNWLFKNIYDWTVYLDTEVDTLKAADAAIGATIKSELGTGKSYLTTTRITCLSTSIAVYPFAFADQVDGNIYKLDTIIGKTYNTTGTWTEGDTGNLFPNIGRIADTAYFLFAIAKDDGTVDIGADNSASASNLLSEATGYTRYRRIGWVMTDQLVNTSLVRYTSFGDNFSITDPTDQMRSWTASTSSTNTKTSAPPNTLANVILTGHSSADRYIILREVGSTDTPPTTTEHTCLTQSDGAGSVSALNAHHVVRVNSSSEVAIRVSSTVDLTARLINTFGWVDERHV